MSEEVGGGELQVHAVCKQVIRADVGDVTAAAFYGNETLATTSRDKSVRIWNYIDDEFVEADFSPLSKHIYPVTHCSVSRNDPLLATTSLDGQVLIWNIQSGELTLSLKHESGSPLRSCDFSPNSATLISGAEDGSVYIWDLTTNTHKHLVSAHDDSVSACTFSPDGQYAVTGSLAGDLRVWDVRWGHGHALTTVSEAHDLGVTTAMFRPVTDVDSPYGMMMLASGGYDCLISLWWLQTTGGALSLYKHMELSGHSANIMSTCFHPRGNIIASTAGDNTLRLWSLNGTCLHVLDKHSRFVSCCAFSYDGSHLASGSNDKTICIWSITFDYNREEEEDEAGESLVRVFTPPLLSLSVPPCDWLVGDVCHWLVNQGMDHCVQHAKNNHVDGEKLLSLSDEETISLLKPSGPHLTAFLEKLVKLRSRDAETPSEYCCPITHSRMIDPVVAADGYSYEHSAIKEWFSRGKRTSPMTNVTLKHIHLTANHNLRILIDSHCTPR